MRFTWRSPRRSTRRWSRRTVDWREYPGTAPGWSCTPRSEVLLYDVIVAGLGGMGSAAAYRLAARGKRVLGLERHTAAHALGSSHGQSRIIRQAYFEDPAYVPLLLRAYELWEELERETGEELMTLCGGLMIGPESGDLVSGSVKSADEHGLPY